MTVSKIVDKITHFYNESPVNKDLSLDLKVEEIFNRMGFNSIFSLILDLFTLGWYRRHSRQIIKDAIFSNSVGNAITFLKGRLKLT